MSTLEVIHACPSQMRALLTTLGMVDSNPSIVIIFETHEVQPHFPYHVDFLVHVECMNNMIKRIVIDDSDAAYVMSLAY